MLGREFWTREVIKTIDDRYRDEQSPRVRALFVSSLIPDTFYLQRNERSYANVSRVDFVVKDHPTTG
jgi:hypothetical protein